MRLAKLGIKDGILEERQRRREEVDTEMEGEDRMC